MTFGQTISYWPFREVLRRDMAITEDDSEKEDWRKLEARVESLFGEDAADVVPYLAPLLSLPPQGEHAKRIEHLDSEAVGRQVFLAARRYLERLAQGGPLVLVFEDLHWMDDSSGRLLEHVLPLVKLVPVLFLGVSRPDPSSSGARLRKIAAAEYPEHTNEVVLSPLSPRDSTAMVRNLLAIEDLPLHVRDLIVRKADGNPFFLEEVLRTLIDAGAIVQGASGGRWVATSQIDNLTVPDNIQGVIMARVDRLDEEAKQVLRTAAVIGQSFLYRVLHEVSEARRELDRHLATLQSVELVLEKQRTPELEFLFKHALAQEATYESILLQRRRELHALVGEAIERLFSKRLDEFYGLLAYHYAKAETWEKAQEFLFKAGDKAGGMAADAEALAHYQQAIDAYSRAFGDRWDPVDRAAVERKIGEALSRRGDHVQAIDYLQRALGHLSRPLPTSPWGTRRAILRELLSQVGRRLWPIGKSRDVPPSRAVEEEYGVYYTMGWIEVFADPERFLLTMLRSLNFSEREGYQLGIATASSGLGTASDFVAQFRLASYLHRRAVVAAEAIQTPDILGLAYQNLAVHEYINADHEAAFQHAEKAQQFHRESGDLHAVGLTMLFVTYVLDVRGQFDAALVKAQEIIDLGDDSGDQQVRCWGEQVSGRIKCRRGELDDARVHLERAVDLADRIPDRLSQVEARSELGRCLLQQGDLDDALSMFEAAEPLRAQFQVRSAPVTPLRNGLAATLLLAADRAEGPERAERLKLARDACKAALRQGKAFRPGMPEAMRLQGTYQWLSNDRSGALKWWRGSVSLAERFQQPLDVARSSLEMGTRLDDAGLIDRAEAIFKELGVHVAPTGVEQARPVPHPR